MGMTGQPCRKLCYYAARFSKKCLFDFVYPINLKSKPSSSMFDGMPMVSVIFLIGEVLR
jgi:hypothetical protein